ncbi:MAG: hypothetical protein MJ016_04370 [Victivallaceae bacterium]|nr:hypothetical protein [Victivallaceae bacterium]
MDIFGAEANLAAFVARTVSLEENRVVFAGDLPSSVPEGIGVSLAASLPATADHQNEAAARVDFCFADRGELETALHALLNVLPLYDSEGFATIETGEPIALSKIVRRGIGVYRAILPLKIAFV